MKISRWLVFLSLIFLFSPSLLKSKPVLADTVKKATPKDPLTPSFQNEELTPFRQRFLRDSLDKLNQQATDLFNNKQQDQAFEIWYREVGLRSYLGVEEEIKTLERIGKVAWDAQRGLDIKTIIKKLQAIQEKLEANKQLNEPNFNLLLQAYQSVHSLDDLLVIYQMKLKIVEKPSAAEEVILEKTAETYLAKFNYTKAAIYYESLLQRVQVDSIKEEEYLKRLAEIYTQTGQKEKAISLREKLTDIYTKKEELSLALGSIIAIGRDYESLKNYDKAIVNYDKAFQLAWSSKYLSYAEQALTLIGELYSKNQQLDYALSTYLSLISIQEMTYNYYGLMQTYSKVGEIYLTYKDYTLALNSFQESLRLAKSIKYDARSFENKVNQVQESIKQKG